MLGPGEPRVEAARSNEAGVGSLLHHAPAIQHEDTVGVAAVTEDNGLIRLEYLADVSSRGSVTRLGFRDLIYRTGPDVILNEAVVSWNGLPLGHTYLKLW